MDDGEDVQVATITTETPVFEGPDATRAAAAELAQSRREAPRARDIKEEPARAPDPEVKEVKYQRDDEPLVKTAREAAKDLGEWREQERQKVELELQSLTGEEAAAEEPAHVPEVEAKPAQRQTPAEAEAARQSRSHYLNMLTTGLQNITLARNTEWADVKTPADAERIAANDPERFQRLQQFAQIEGFVMEKAAEAQKAAGNDQADAWKEYAKQQDEIFEKSVPELADPARKAEFQRTAHAVLNEVGVTDAELNALYHGKTKVDFRDARVQRIIADAARWNEAKARAGNVTRKPMPQVQRPGVAQMPGVHAAESIERLTRRVENSTGQKALRAAAALLHNKRSARR